MREVYRNALHPTKGSAMRALFARPGRNRSLPRPERTIAKPHQDFRCAVRSLPKALGLPSIVGLVIASGVVADTTFLGTIDRIVISPIPHSEPARSVKVEALDPQATVEKGATLLHKAADEGSIELIASMLAMGSDVNVRDDAGATPIFYAARSGQVETAEYLVANGADVHATDFLLATPLHYLFERRVGQRHLETMRLLIAAGVQVARSNGGVRGSSCTPSPAETWRLSSCCCLREPMSTRARQTTPRRSTMPQAEQTEIS